MDVELAELSARVQDAARSRSKLCIRGGGTKDFYGNDSVGEQLDTRRLSGIVAYEPTELVITVRCGTRLSETESLLASHGQMLAFEPPHFGSGTTIGGCVAAGLSGPRRAAFGPHYGTLRDFVLGARLVDGRGRMLSFGGTVIKNVAGYDVSRVLAGSLGILGVITEVSLKVLPLPTVETSVVLECTEAEALQQLRDWRRRPLAISASAWLDGRLALRISGARSAVKEAVLAIGGETIDGGEFWRELRDHALPFFAGDMPCWRLSVPANAGPLMLDGPQLIEWKGALRWLRSTMPASVVRARVQALGGHATLFRGGDRAAGAFTPLVPAVAAIHRRLKAEFDPVNIFNIGRMYPEF